MEEDFKEFVDNRINNSLAEFKKQSSWKKATNKFNSKYEDLYNTLSESEKSNLEDIKALFYNLSTEEQYIIYKIGFTDGMTLKRN